LLAFGVLAIFIAVWCVESCVAAFTARRRVSGHRGHGAGSWRRTGLGIVFTVMLASVLSLVMLPVWSIARRWRFPDALPSSWSFDYWSRRSELLLEPMQTTLGLALVTALLALMAAITWLELERKGRAWRIDWLWYVPLLIPQVSLLFGWQASALLLSADGLWATVAYAHWIYALPYVVLILAVAWREFDPNWNHAAAVLGAGYWRILLKVRLPLLLKPVCQAAAVAVAVSVAQYLPTLLLGAGRHQTLAIELVTSFGGVDRRTIAALAVLQSLLPLIAFVAAIVIPSRLVQKRGQA